MPYFEDAVLEAVARNPEARILIVGDGINELDAAGEEVFRHLVQRLRDTGVNLAFSGLKHQVMQVMERTGLCELVGNEHVPHRRPGPGSHPLGHRRRKAPAGRL